MTYWDDLKLAVRSLRKSPAFTVVATVTLAIGIGATTTIFSVVHSVLLNPMPFDHSERLVRLFANKPAEGVERAGLSGADFIDFRERLGATEALGAYRWFGLSITGVARPRELTTILVTPGLLGELGQPHHGRTFGQDEGAPGQGNVVVLGYGFWQSHFGGDPGAVGQTMLLDGEEFEVVGVMPADFAMPVSGIELWAPWTLDPTQLSREGRWFNVLGRLAPDLTLEAAQAEATALARSLETEYPASNDGWGVELVSLHEEVVSAARPALITLFLAVVVVLLIACANVANLVLARGLARRDELALRSALGAHRLRLLRQLLVESQLLAFLGGGAGVALAFVGVRALVAVSPDGLPRVEEIGIDAPILAFALVTTVLVAVLFGLVPALRLTAPEMARGLNEAGRGSEGSAGGTRLRSAITVAQIALSLLLLVGAGLLLRSFQKLVEVDPGFTARGRLALQLFVYGERYEEPEKKRLFFARLFEEIEAVPGVTSVGGVSALPLSPVSGGTTQVQVVGREEPEAEQAAIRVATPGFFETMGIRRLEGRLFNQGDHGESVPVALLNLAAAKRFFPGESPVGEMLDFGDLQLEIVGVVGDVRARGLDQASKPGLYTPYDQNITGTLSVVVQTETAPEALVLPIQDRVWRVDPNQPIWRTVTLDALIEEDTAQERFYALLVSLFAGVALLLAAIGVYGVISYSVAGRQQEIGLRMAIGANRGQILAMVLGSGSRLIAVGLFLGLGLSLLLGTLFSRLMSGLLFEVGPVDPPTLAGVSLLMTVAGLLACLLPARRASRLDPVQALHVE